MEKNRTNFSEEDKKIVRGVLKKFETPEWKQYCKEWCEKIREKVGRTWIPSDIMLSMVCNIKDEEQVKQGRLLLHAMGHNGFLKVRNKKNKQLFRILVK